MQEDALRVLEAWPTGCHRGVSLHRRYIVAKTDVAGGRGTKLQAWEVGGPDYISLNVYWLTSGARLFPCEMPQSKVVAFLCDLRRDMS